MTEEFLVGIEEEPETLVINDRWGVSGALEISIKSNNEATIGNLEKEFLITGALKTNFYVPDLKKIECRRYIVTGINVEQEEYESATDNIIYRFEADGFRVKYQVAQVVDIEKLMEDNDLG